MSAPDQLSCKSTPISWLELERYVLGESEREAELGAHLQSCSACELVAQRIRDDARMMPALVMSVAPMPERRWAWRWRFALTLLPVVVLLVFLRPRGEHHEGGDGLRSGVKGGDASFVLVREHDSQLLDPSRFAPGDRFHVQLSCAPGAAGDTFVDLVIEQAGQFYYPLASTWLRCGNGVSLPGAFTLDGKAPARVCLVLAGHAVDRASIPDDAMCTELAPALAPTRPAQP